MKDNITTGTQIYGLVDPRKPGLVMYVGKTNSPSRRLLNHVNHARLGKCNPVNRWVAGLLNEGIRPEIITLQRCDLSNWKILERCHINWLRLVNPNLLNKAEGGGGQTSRESKKNCGVCGGEKEVINNTTRELTCRPCTYASQRRFRERNRERIRAKDRARYARRRSR